MTRLDGEKKSPLPWIIGLLVLALLAAAIYYFTVAKGTDAVTVNGNGVELQNNAPGGLGEGNATDANATDANATDANSTDMNVADANALDANSAIMDANSAMGNSMDSNSAMSDSNSAMMNSSTMDSNSAMSDSNSAMMNSSTMMDNSAPVAGVTPAAAAGSKSGSDVIATRSKTIKTDDATVTYKKSVKADGSLTRDKTIVPKPVEQAKKNQ